MALYKVRMRQRAGVRTEIEFEQHADSEAEAQRSAARKFPVHDVIAISKIEMPNHDLSVRVAAEVLKLAKRSKSPYVRTVGILNKPLAEVAVNIEEAVVRRVWSGETSVEDIATAIFEQLLPD